VLSLVDVSERKRAEIQLARQNQELRELSVAERRQRELAEGLVQATIAINTSLKRDQVLCSILEQIRKTIPFQGAEIVLVQGNTSRVASFLGFEDYPQSIPFIDETENLDEDPLLKQVYLTHLPTLIDSVTEYSGWQSKPGLEWVRSYVAVPLIITGEFAGIVNLYSETDAAFDQDALEQLISFTAPASAALHNAQIYQAESNARQLAETLSAAAQALTQTLDLEYVFDTLLDHTHTILPSETAGVTLLADETHLAVRALRGYGFWANRDDIPTFPTTGITDSLIHRLISTGGVSRSQTPWLRNLGRINPASNKYKTGWSCRLLPASRSSAWWNLVEPGRDLLRRSRFSLLRLWFPRPRLQSRTPGFSSRYAPAVKGCNPWPENWWRSRKKNASPSPGNCMTKPGKRYLQ
jgi:GAF domain-containing protein